MCLGENLERKRKRICIEKCLKMPKIIFYFIIIILSKGALWVFIDFL